MTSDSDFCVLLDELVEENLKKKSKLQVYFQSLIECKKVKLEIFICSAMDGRNPIFDQIKFNFETII